MDIERIIREVSEEIGAPDRRCAYGANGSVRLREHAGAGVSIADVPSKLEHSLLVPDLSEKALLEACVQARRYKIAAICIPPYYVASAKKALRGSGIHVCAALGVPNALISAEARLADAKYSLLAGADEIDVSMNTMAIKSGYMDDALSDLRDIVRAARGKASVKAAVELSLFTEDEKCKVLHLVKESGAEYMKIQNVLSGKKADVSDIKYVKSVLGNNVRIKIDGGVKTLDAAMGLISFGADRIGLTSTFSIAEGAVKRTLKYPG
jgi:deoxyribose-phosphate aldolase